MHHGDQPSPKFKVLVTNVDSGPGGHVVNIQDGELTELVQERVVWLPVEWQKKKRYETCSSLGVPLDHE
jgi:hypothetical protein